VKTFRHLFVSFVFDNRHLVPAFRAEKPTALSEMEEGTLQHTIRMVVLVVRSLRTRVRITQPLGRPAEHRANRATFATGCLREAFPPEVRMDR